MDTANAPADKQIVRRVLAGQHEDFALLVQRHLPAVHALAYAHTSNHADAEDIVQETFLKAYVSLDTLRQAGKFRSWIATIARNTALGLLRQRKRRAESPEEAARREPSETPDMGSREIRALLRSHIDKLDEPHREVLLLHYFAGLTTRQVGETLGISKAAAQKRLQRARDTLGQTLVGKLAVEPPPSDAVENQAKRIMGLVLATPVTWKAATAGGLGASIVSTLVLTSSAKMLVAGLALLTLLGLGGWQVLQSQQKESTTDPAGSAPAEISTRKAPVGAEERSGEGSAESDIRLTTDTAERKAASAEGGPNTAVETASEPEGGIIRGRVYDAKTGEGVEGVTFMPMSQEKRRSVGKSAKSDADGNYVISGLPDASYTLWPRPPAKYVRPDERRVVTVSKDTPLEGIDFALERGIRIAGRVVDNEGMPVAAGVLARGKFSIHGGDGRSGSNGAFEIYVPVASNDFYLMAATETFESSPAGPLKVPPEGLGDIDLALTNPRTACVSGVVVDAAGRPLKDMLVQPMREGILQFVPRSQQDSQKTTDSGRFSVSGLAAGTHHFLVLPSEKSMFSIRDSVTEVALKEGEKKENLRLVYGAVSGLTISGRVVDTAGKPIGEANISCSGRTRGRARSGKDGDFCISGLVEGAYGINVHHGGHTDAHVGEVPAGSAGLEIIMLGTGSAEGRVVRADNGEPVVDFELFYNVGGYGSVPLNGRTIHHAEGRFKRDGLHAGEGTLTVRALGFAPASQRLTFAENETVTDILFQLEKCEAFIGTVVNSEGGPVANASIYFGGIREGTNSEHGVVAKTDSTGTFTIESIDPAVRRIAAYHPDYAPGVAPATPDTQIVLPAPVTLKGVVYEDGKPVPKIDVSASFVPEMGLRHTHTVTDENGAYELTGLTPGTAQVSVRGLGQSSRQTTKILTFEAGTAAEMDFHFAPASSQLEGTVSAAGEPVEKATVHLRVATAGDEETRFIVTDATGSYHFDNLPAGEVHLRVDKRSPEGTLHVRNAHVILPEDTLLKQDINFAGGASLEAHIKGFSSDLNGSVLVLTPNQPLPATLTWDSLRGRHDDVMGGGQCAPDGSVLFEDLEPGEYIAIASVVPQAERSNPDSMRFASTPVRLTDGETKTIEFDFR